MSDKDRQPNAKHVRRVKRVVALKSPQPSGIDLDAALTERLEQMREEERTRIARELHDELGQLLTCIKLDFVATVRRLRELKTPGDVVDRLQSAVGQIDLGIQMVRRIATGLRPPGLDHRDLGGAIEYEARRMSAIASIAMPVTARVSETVDPEIATVAFRVFEEALTNCVRHAHATCVTTTIATTRRGKLTLHVSDNGVGIASPRLNKRMSLGLLGMSERARTVGGTLRITSRAGQGTRVLLTLPLRRDAAPASRAPRRTAHASTSDARTRMAHPGVRHR
jgi:signal transduction histidine kinase